MFQCFSDDVGAPVWTSSSEDGGLSIAGRFGEFSPKWLRWLARMVFDEGQRCDL